LLRLIWQKLGYLQHNLIETFVPLEIKTHLFVVTN